MARFSTHGVAAIVEFPTNLQKITHNLQGTTISQNSLTDNWLHLPIAAERETGGLSAQQALGVFFRCTLNENARINEIRLTDERQIRFKKTVNFIGEEVDTEISFAAVTYVGGLLLTLHVLFLDGTPRGQMEFRNGGAVTKRVVGPFGG